MMSRSHFRWASPIRTLTSRFVPATASPVTWRFSEEMGGDFYGGVITYLGVRFNRTFFQDIQFTAASANIFDRIFYFRVSGRVVIEDCQFVGKAGGLDSRGSILFATQGIDDSIIRNNAFSFGYRALDISGNGIVAANNLIEGNTFSSQAEHAIYLDDITDSVVDNNQISDTIAQSNATYTGIYVDGGSGMEITRNDIKVAGRAARNCLWSDGAHTSRVQGRDDRAADCQ